MGQRSQILVEETRSQMEPLKLCFQENLESKLLSISPAPPGLRQAPLCFPQFWLGKARCCWPHLKYGENGTENAEW